MHSYLLWGLTIASLLAAMVLAFLMLRCRRGRVPFALALILMLGMTGFGGWRLKQRNVRHAQALNDYYAALDEIARGDMKAAEKHLQESLSNEPGLPGARGKLRKLRATKTAAPRQTQLALQPAPGQRPGEKAKHPYHKPTDIRIDFYDLQVNINPASHTLSGTALITIVARKDTPTADFSLGPQFQVNSVMQASERAPFRRANNLLSIGGKPLQQNETRHYRIAYQLNKPTKVLQGGDVLSQEGSYLRAESRWYPGIGELSFYSPVRVRVTVPKGYQAISVGRLTQEEAKGDQTLYQWESGIPTRMISLVIGRYATNQSTAGNLAISTYLFGKHAKLSGAYLSQSKAIVSYYTRLYGPFPYDKLAIAEIPYFPGGYGSPSLVMLTEQSFAAGRMPVRFLSHELAHQWWGGAVSPKGPGAGFMSEAFAEYSSYLYADQLSGGKTLAKDIRKAMASYVAEAQAKGEEPIGLTDPYAQAGAYTGSIYMRGACVLHMLRHIMGDHTFFVVLRKFMTDYRGKQASISDFRHSCELGYGQSLKWFFEEWLYRPGIMKIAYNYSMSHQPDGRYAVTLMIQQPGRPYQMPVDLCLQTASGKVRRTIRIQKTQDEFRFTLDSPLVGMDFDPDGWLMLPTPRRITTGR